MRKVIYTFLSLFLIFAPAYAYASPAGWALQNVNMQGSTAIVTAAKQGFKSVANYAPTAIGVGKEVVKVGTGLAVIYAVNELLGDGIEWVMTTGGDVKYKVPPSADQTVPYVFQCNYSGCPTTTFFSSKDALQSRFLSDTRQGGGVFDYRGSHVPGSSSISVWYVSENGTYNVGSSVTNPSYDPTPKEQTLPLSAIASKVISNASAGHGPSQELVKAAAVTSFNTGALDTDLEENAVPSDTPLDPTDPTSPSYDPSSILSAIASLRSAVDNLATDIKQKFQTLAVSLGVIEAKVDNVALEQQRTMQVINDGMADVVAANQATEARVGDVVAAIEALEGNTLDGKVINDAVDRAIAAGHSDTASIVAAIEAIEGNTLDGQVINDAVDKVIANDDANAKAANDVVSDSVDKAIEAGQADATKVADAVDAQTDAITTTDPTTGEKSLSLPSFCSWAGPVCTFIDWSKNQWLEFTLTFTALKDWLFEDASPNDKDNTLDTPVLPVTPVQVAINFVGSCPAPLTFEYKIYNQTFKPSVPFTPMCEVAVMINPVIKICASIGAIFIVAGIRQGNS